MLSSRINPDDSDDDNNNEGQSIMPGDYETPAGAASRFAPSRPAPPLRPIVPSTSRTSRRPPIAPSTSRPSRRPPIVPSTIAPRRQPPGIPPTSPIRTRSSRRRSLTPEVVIEKRHHHHHHHHHSSSGRRRIFTIPLDNRPTLGLRGPPKRILEIERIPCRRRRKHHSSCYEIEYNYSSPVPPLQFQPQPNIIVANPVPNPCLPPDQSSLTVPASNSKGLVELFSNLTPEIIQNLPKQTIHLPPLHLPGSQANAETELETVIFPAEIINPIDGTLSIIRSNSTINNVASGNSQPSVFTSVQPQLISVPTKVESPLEMLASASGPFMQQVHDLFQRITLSQSQPTSSPFNHAFAQPSVPVSTQNIPATNSFNNSLSIPSITTLNTGPYPPANIRPAIIPNTGSYNPTTFTSSIPANITPYRPANITSRQPTTTTPYRPANITPYRPANTTSSNPTGTTPYRPANITSFQSSNTVPYNPANITPYRPANITSFQSSNTVPYNPANITPYRPANITPYQPTRFTPANPANTRSYNPSSIAPPSSSNTGPYRPANITPYGTGPNRSGSNSLFTRSIPSTSIPLNPSSSFASSTSFSSSPSDINNRPLNVPYSSQSISQTPYQSSTSMPKSILRNSLSNTPLNTAYSRLNPPNISSPNGIVREMATIV